MPPTKRPRPSTPPPDPLVPIRLDLNVDGHRIQDTFLWNLHETTLTPADFSTHLAADLNLPESARLAIASSIQEQISSFVPPPPPPPTECRHVVHLSLRLGRILVRDTFEWDLNEPRNSPEMFAERLCADLGLESVHVPAVAHAVREQLVELGEFRDKRQKCRVVKEVFKMGGGVNVEVLSKEEVERLERKEKREARLVRRNRGKAESYGRGGRRRSESSRRRSAY